MPTKLSETPEEKIRQFLTDNIRSSEIQGYDPNQTDTQSTDFLPVTSNWSDYGDYYPMIYVGEEDGPTVPNSGNTGFNGFQADGSGPNQWNIKNITLSVQAVEEGSYLNGTDAKTLINELYQECHHQIQNNPTALAETEHIGITPPTWTKNQEETDSGSTITWLQAQGTVYMGVIDEP